jgi:hypothetical protein
VNILINPQTGTTYTYTQSDFNKLVTFDNASAISATLPQAGSGGNFGSGWWTESENLGAGTVTITPTTSTIDGASTITLTTNQGVQIVSDGVNYFTQRGMGGGGGSAAGSSGDIQFSDGSGGFLAAMAPDVLHYDSSHSQLTMVSNSPGFIMLLLTMAAGATAAPVSVTDSSNNPVFQVLPAGDLMIHGIPYTFPSSLPGSTSVLQCSSSGVITFATPTVDPDFFGSKSGLTNHSATSFVEIAVPAADFCGGLLTYTLYATDGTDRQSISGMVKFTATATGTTVNDPQYTSDLQTSASVTIGKLTSLITVTTGSNLLIFQVTPGSSLALPTINIVYTIRQDTSQTVTAL